MAVLLHVDASARSSRSLSRDLSRAFVDAWTAARPDDTVVRRDVGRDPPPAVTEAWIAAAFTPSEERSTEQAAILSPSDTLVDEVLRANIVVVGTPMYNYGMPAALKAWVDQVIRIGRTFTFDLARGEQPIEPVQTGKTLVTLTASGEGGFAPGGPHAAVNHLDTHLGATMHLFGCSTQHVVRIEYQEFADARHEASIAAAHREVLALARELAAQ